MKRIISTLFVALLTNVAIAEMISSDTIALIGHIDKFSQITFTTESETMEVNSFNAPITIPFKVTTNTNYNVLLETTGKFVNHANGDSFNFVADIDKENSIITVNPEEITEQQSSGEYTTILTISVSSL
jgi:hypothetical protein